MRTKFINRSWNIVVSFLFLACLISANIASAATIDFGVNEQAGSNPPGTFTWSPGDILSISGIEVDAVSVLGDPISVLTLTNGVLDLTGMHYIGFQSVPNIGNLYFFDASGTTMISATSSTNLANNTAAYGNTTLMQGDLTGLVAVFPTGKGLFQNPSPFILGGWFIDSKNERLLYELGLLPSYDPSEPLVGPFTGQLNLSFVWDPELENFRVGSGDVFNTPVPIPGTIVLLGGGLLGLIGIRRRLSR